MAGLVFSVFCIISSTPLFQRIAADCSGLQRIAADCSGLQRIAADCSGLPRIDSSLFLRIV
jgi:hypothetical protein